MQVEPRPEGKSPKGLDYQNEAETLPSSNMKYVRRFVFVHYEDLLNIRFKKLEKVTDKLYVFIGNSVEQMPVWLVKQVQEMGRDLEWVDIGVSDREMTNTLMAFTIGTLHEKVDLGVEFAILSNDERLDHLVEHICNGERNCVRVKQGATVTEDEGSIPAPVSNLAATAASRPVARTVLLSGELDEDLEEVDLDEEALPHTPKGFDDFSRFKEGANGEISAKKEGTFNLRPRLQKNQPAAVEQKDVNVASLADGVVRRLIRSGNRPADVSMLRSYILLHSDDATAMEYVQEMIEHMARTGEIKVEDNVIQYNF